MSDKNIKQKNPTFIIMKRELKSYFSGPIGYIVTGLFLIISGFIFFSTFFLQNRAELRSFFSLLPILLSFFVPALTMRVFAEEKRVGSIETLMTLPVTETNVVAGKFLAAFIETLVMIAPTLFYVVAAEIFGEPDYGPIVGGYLGAIFLCASFTAIGIFTSAITKNQIIAFLAGIAICVALTMIDFLLIFLPSGLSSFLSFISAKAHFTSIARGIIDSGDFIYFISLTALFFAATVKVRQLEKA